MLYVEVEKGSGSARRAGVATSIGLLAGVWPSSSDGEGTQRLCIQHAVGVTRGGGAHKG